MYQPKEEVTRRGFMPPFILQRLADQGDDRLRHRARETLDADYRFRSQRSPLVAEKTSLPPGSPAPGEPARYVYSAENQQVLPGVLLRQEGQPPSEDVTVNEAYRWLGVTYRFFWEIFGRHSIDDQGMPLLGTVHFGKEYDNAFWNGVQMVFGDGNGVLFNRFTTALDVVGHEVSHGVIEREAGLIYTYQSGALNESLADVFGSLVEQFHRRQTADQADWLIGAELLTERVQGRALRSMAEPGTAYDDPMLGRDPQPGHMDAFVETSEDNGGVHINSGIPNRAFYLAATALGGFAWEAAGLVWYDTLKDPRLEPDCDFITFAALTVDNAARRFGEQSRETVAVARAWQTVGVVS